MYLDELYKQFFSRLLEGDRRECSRLIKEALNNKLDIHSLYIEVFQRAMIEVGELWQKNIISVAKEHLCTAIIQSIIMQLYEYIKPERFNGGTAVISCVGNELHEIGARMVSDFFELEGWDVTYLGANMPERDLLKVVEEKRPNILGISCTMPVHVPYVKDIIAKVRSIDYKILIAVGGYCFNKRPELQKFVGADIWSPNAVETVKLANRLLANDKMVV